MSLSIVIPAYNEERRLARTLDTLLDGLDPQIGRDWEIVVCDDGSDDATADVVAARRTVDDRVQLVSHLENRGKGAALTSGFRRATREWVLLLDADLPVPLSTMSSFLEVGERADVVTGSRRLTGSVTTTSQPLLRRVGGRLFRTCVDVLGFGGFSDPQCGVKLLRRDRLEPVFDAMALTRFGFDVELLTRCRVAGLVVVEEAVTWTHVEGSTLRPVRDAVVTLGDLIRLRRDLRGSAAVHRLPTRP